MGALQEILDTIRDINKTLGAHKATFKAATTNTSISKSSMEGIFNFPVVVSNAMTIDDASLVSKALERQYASFLLTTMTMNPMLDITDMGDVNPRTYIKKFHQNNGSIGLLTTEGATSDDVINQAVDVLNEMFNVEYTIEGTCIGGVYSNVKSYEAAKLLAKHNYCVTDVLESSIVNDKFKKIGDRKIVKPVREADYYDEDDDYNTFIQHAKLDANEANKNRAFSVRPMEHLMNNDVKKANELVPTLLHVRFLPYSISDKHEMTNLPPVDFVVGVKTTLHPVSSDEMVLNMARGVKNDNKFFNFIRWTTGEISFFKDFLFSLNELKLDAINNSDTSSKWWTTLKRRKNIANIKRVMKENILPNATIVLTKEEVDIVKKYYGYDLYNPFIMDKVMSHYYLLGFVIVDPALQRVDFLFDGKKEYETMTFAGLARENTVDDKKFKDMMSMLGRRM